MRQSVCSQEPPQKSASGHLKEPFGPQQDENWLTVATVMHLFDKRKNHILSHSTKPSKHWWERQEKKTKRNDSNTCAKHSKKNCWIFCPYFCVSSSIFPLNLTDGGWSTTEKYLTTENCWSETNPSSLPPGRSPGHVWNRTWTRTHMQTHICTPTDICQRHFVPKISYLGATNVQYSKFKMLKENILLILSKCSRPFFKFKVERTNLFHTHTYVLHFRLLPLSKHKTSAWLNMTLSTTIITPLHVLGGWEMRANTIIPTNQNCKQSLIQSRHCNAVYYSSVLVPLSRN